MARAKSKYEFERKPASGMPASGIPASGIAASGIPASGPGIGGLSRAQKLALAVAAPEDGIEEVERPLTADELAEEAMKTMVTIMRTCDYPATKLAAAEKVYNQLRGTPVQRQIVQHQQAEIPDRIDARRLTPEQREALKQILLVAASDQAQVIDGA